MATNPGDIPADVPQPSQPVTPDAPPPEINPPGHDIDVPAPGAPSGDPVPVNPSI